MIRERLKDMPKLSRRQLYYLGWNFNDDTYRPTKKQIKQARQKKMMEGKQ